MSDSYCASALPTGLSSLRDEAADASSPKASIPSREAVLAVVDEMRRMMPHSTADWRLKLTLAVGGY